MIPYSHRLPEAEGPPSWHKSEREVFHPSAVAAAAPAGSVLMFDCRLHHTKAPNETDAERIAVQVRSRFPEAV